MNYVRREFIQGAPVSQNYIQHSPSALNLFAAQPSMFVLEKILGLKQPVGAVAHRGVAIEDGVAHGLKDPKASDADSIKIAQAKFDLLTAMSGDARREKYRADIPDMVTTALDELRPYGVPTETQGFITWQPEGLRLPIVGYSDFMWADKGIIVDLKTTDRMPSEIKVGHARQVSLYSGDNHEGRLCYVTPKKVQVLQLENIREHRQALFNIAKKVENFLALSEDPAFFTTIVAPDLDSFYWTNPIARQLAFEHFGV
jgi:hypothetical protein